jgi:hypothetical protein
VVRFGQQVGLAAQTHGSALITPVAPASSAIGSPPQSGQDVLLEDLRIGSLTDPCFECPPVHGILRAPEHGCPPAVPGITLFNATFQRRRQ